MKDKSDCEQSKSPEQEMIRERRRMVIQGLLAEVSEAHCFAQQAAAIRDVIGYLRGFQTLIEHAEFDDAYHGLNAIIVQKQQQEDAEDREAGEFDEEDDQDADHQEGVEVDADELKQMSDLVSDMLSDFKQRQRRLHTMQTRLQQMIDQAANA